MCYNIKEIVEPDEQLRKSNRATQASIKCIGGVFYETKSTYRNVIRFSSSAVL